MEEDASDREEDDSSDESYMAKPRKRLRKRKATKKDSEEEKEDTGEEQRTSDEEYKIPLGIGMPQSSSEESDEVYDEEILGSVGEDEVFIFFFPLFLLFFFFFFFSFPFVWLLMLCRTNLLRRKSLRWKVKAGWTMETRNSFRNDWRSSCASGG